MPSVLTLEGLGQQVDPFESPRDEGPRPRSERPRKPRKQRNQPSARERVPLPSNPDVGDCACRWNPRKKRWTKLCFVGKGTGRGQTRSGWMIRKDEGNFCSRKGG